MPATLQNCQLRIRKPGCKQTRLLTRNRLILLSADHQRRLVNGTKQREIILPITHSDQTGRGAARVSGRDPAGNFCDQLEMRG